MPKKVSIHLSAAEGDIFRFTSIFQSICDLLSSSSPIFTHIDPSPGELSGLLEGKRSQITSSTQRDQQLQRDLQRIEQAMGGQADLAQKLAEAQRQSKGQ